MNFMLFGPPGIGKSTIIGILKTKGIGALDLEDLYPNRIRFQIPTLVSDKVLGAADLNPQRSYPKARKILLTAEQDSYERRREARDAKQVGKGKQKTHQVSAWEKGVNYDLIIDTTKLSADQTADRIISFIQEGGKL